MIWDRTQENNSIHNDYQKRKTKQKTKEYLGIKSIKELNDFYNENYKTLEKN